MEAEKNLSQCAGIFQVFGLLYFSVKSKGKKRFKFHIFYFIFMFILLLIEIVIFGWMVSKESPEIFSDKNALNYIMQYFLFIGLVVVIGTSLIQSFCTTEILKKIFNNFLKISQLFQSDFGTNFNYIEVKSKIFKLVFQMIFLHILTQSLNIIYEVQREVPSALIKAFFGNIPLAFLAMTIAKFIFFVNAINCQLKQIKILLEKIIMRRNFCGVLQVISKRSKSEILMESKIKSFLKIYNIIYENSQLINKSMGFTNLVIIFVLVITLINGGYRVFLVLVGKFDSDKIGGLVVGVLLALYLLILIVLKCDRTENMVSVKKHIFFSF